MPLGLGFFATAGAGGALANSFDLLETTILGSSTSTVTFSNLNTYSDYKHLQFRIVTRATDSAGSTGFLNIRINGVTTSTYGSHTMNGRADAVRSAGNGSWNSILNNVTIPLGNTSSNAFSATVIDILDFNNSNKKPTIRTFSGVAISEDPYVVFTSGMLDSQAAMNSISFFGWSMAANTRFSLYGIKG